MFDDKLVNTNAITRYLLQLFSSEDLNFGPPLNSVIQLSPHITLFDWLEIIASIDIKNTKMWLAFIFSNVDWSSKKK